MRRERLLHEVTHDLYITLNIISVTKGRRLYGRGRWQTEKRIQDFGGESEGMRSHGGPRCGWENTIKNWISETGRQAVYWTQVKQDWESV
jgi:hypothetical protein